MKKYNLLISGVSILLILTACVNGGEAKEETMTKLATLANKPVVNLEINTTLSKNSDSLLGKFNVNKVSDTSFSLSYDYEVFNLFNIDNPSMYTKSNITGTANLLIDEQGNVSSDVDLPFRVGPKMGVSFSFNKAYFSDVSETGTTFKANVKDPKAFSGISNAKSMNVDIVYTNEHFESINLSYINNNDYACTYVYTF